MKKLFVTLVTAFALATPSFAAEAVEKDDHLPGIEVKQQVVDETKLYNSPKLNLELNMAFTMYCLSGSTCNGMFEFCDSSIGNLIDAYIELAGLC